MNKTCFYVSQDECRTALLSTKNTFRLAKRWLQDMYVDRDDIDTDDSMMWDEDMWDDEMDDFGEW